MQLMAFHEPQRLRHYSLLEDCNAHKHAPRQEAFQCVVNQIEERGGINIKGKLKTIPQVVSNVLPFLEAEICKNWLSLQKKHTALHTTHNDRGRI